MADMMTIQFYKNKYVYPDFILTLEAVGGEVSCTPINFGLRTGTIKVSRNLLNMESANYIKFKREGTNRTFWAWIDDIQTAGENLWTVTYTVDAWRTYQNVIDLDTQFVTRSPVSTILRDPLLASRQPFPDVVTKNFEFQKAEYRTFIIQVRILKEPFVYSRVPVQPSPYQIYAVDYEVNDWTNNAALVGLMRALSTGAETQNIVTMYSIPYMNSAALPTSPISIYIAGTAEPTIISGFRFLGQAYDPSGLLVVLEPLTFDHINLDDMMRVPHSVQIVIPDAGIINIPDELLYKPGLALRQDVDLFSGASNYMIVAEGEKFYTCSARGASVTSIPVISDPYDTYMSQNQNALTTSLLGDVASIAGGIGLAVTSGGIGAAAGGGMIASGLTGLAGTYAQNKDAGAQYSNPPAFLGTALAGRFSQKFWMVITTQAVTNAGLVHAENGYPLNMMTPLEFPWNGGYIETKGCAVHSNDGTVPRWAIQEINQLFDNGIEVKTS